MVDRKNGLSDEARRLEVIEQAMKELAAQRLPDIQLIARLDRLRAQARDALRRS